MGHVYMGTNASAIPCDRLSRSQSPKSTRRSTEIHLSWICRSGTRHHQSVFPRSVYLRCGLPLRHIESQENGPCRSLILRPFFLWHVSRKYDPVCLETRMG